MEEMIEETPNKTKLEKLKIGLQEIINDLEKVSD